MTDSLLLTAVNNLTKHGTKRNPADLLQASAPDHSSPVRCPLAVLDLADPCISAAVWGTERCSRPPKPVTTDS